MRSQRKDAAETQKLQRCFDEHFFSELTLSIITIKHAKCMDMDTAYSLNSEKVDEGDPDQLQQTLCEACGTWHHECDKAGSLPQRKSWLNDYHDIIAVSFPNYGKYLQDYLRDRTQETTDNNGRKSLCIRTDRSWDYELQQQNMSRTCHTILELLNVNTEDYEIQGHLRGWTIHILLIPV